jgi:hypothetical protein
VPWPEAAIRQARILLDTRSGGVSDQIELFNITRDIPDPWPIMFFTFRQFSPSSLKGRIFPGLWTKLALDLSQEALRFVLTRDKDLLFSSDSAP